MKRSQCFRGLWAVCLVVLSVCAGGAACMAAVPKNGNGYGLSYLFFCCAVLFYLLLYRLSPKPDPAREYGILRRADTLWTGVFAVAVTVAAFRKIYAPVFVLTAIQKCTHILVIVTGLLAGVLLLYAAFSASPKAAGAGVSAFLLWIVAEIVATASSIFFRPDVLLYLPRVTALFCVGASVWKLYAISRGTDGKGIRFLTATVALGSCLCAADAVFWFCYLSNPYDQQQLDHLLFALLFSGYLAWMSFTLKRRIHLNTKEDGACIN